jgi:hypothetical protein
LAHQAKTSGANGCADRHFSRSRRGSRKQERRDIRGSDQEQEDNATHQQQERLAILTAQQ